MKSWTRNLVGAALAVAVVFGARFVGIELSEEIERSVLLGVLGYIVGREGVSGVERQSRNQALGVALIPIALLSGGCAAQGASSAWHSCLFGAAVLASAAGAFVAGRVAVVGLLLCLRKMRLVFVAALALIVGAGCGHVSAISPPTVEDAEVHGSFRFVLSFGGFELPVEGSGSAELDGESFGTVCVDPPLFSRYCVDAE